MWTASFPRQRPLKRRKFLAPALKKNWCSGRNHWPITRGLDLRRLPTVIIEQKIPRTRWRRAHANFPARTAVRSTGDRQESWLHGAESANVLKLILRHGLTLIVPGIVLGLAGALVLTRLIESTLYGLRPGDSATLVTVSLLLFVAALLASYISARRAIKVDPLVALRYE
jgi:hypothetical protein